MSAGASEYFTEQRVVQLWREIENLGFVQDEFLASEPDCPVFGFNLTCAFPFPPEVEQAYLKLAEPLAGLARGAYTYPLWETHVTLMTFVNFSLYKHPSAAQVGELRAWMAPIVDVIRPLFEKEGVKPFQLEFQRPVLTRKAVILPVANPSGEIALIRRRVGQLLENNKGLHAKLSGAGLNVPGIIHSTIMRWEKAPRVSARLISGFEKVFAAAVPFTINVHEILFTTEIKPYMRASEIVHRFRLSDLKPFYGLTSS